MGRYLNPSLCVSPLGGRTIRLYCKLRYIITILRTLPHLAKTPLSQDISANSLLSAPLHISTIRRGTAKTSRLIKHRYPGITPGHLLRNGSRGIQYTQALRYCSTSGRGAVKAEAPIGVYEESQTAFQLSMLRVRLGESFIRLSSHINCYFKGKNVSVSPGALNACLASPTPERVSRAQRRVHSKRVARDRSLTEDRDSTQTIICEESQRPSESLTEIGTKGQIYAGLQLFHPSSLATRFGESYNYVAHHINSAFSKSPALDVQMQETQDNLASHRGSTRRERRRILMRSHDENMKGTEPAQLETSAAPVLTSTVDSDDVPSNWDEGYIHFSEHINRYFGAKVSDETEPNPQQREHTGVNHVPSVPLERKQEEHILRPQSPGLFHTSSISTSFGESYAQMANHVNRYFKGQGALEEEQEEGYRQQDEEIESKSASSQKQKAVSFMDYFRQPSSAIPNLLGGYLNKTAKTTTAHSEASINRRVSHPKNSQC